MTQNYFSLRAEYSEFVKNRTNKLNAIILSNFYHAYFFIFISFHIFPLLNQNEYSTNLNNQNQFLCVIILYFAIELLGCHTGNDIFWLVVN